MTANAQLCDLYGVKEAAPAPDKMPVAAGVAASILGFMLLMGDREHRQDLLAEADRLNDIARINEAMRMEAVTGSFGGPYQPAQQAAAEIMKGGSAVKVASASSQIAENMGRVMARQNFEKLSFGVIKALGGGAARLASKARGAFGGAARAGVKLKPPTGVLNPGTTRFGVLPRVRTVGQQRVGQTAAGKASMLFKPPPAAKSLFKKSYVLKVGHVVPRAALEEARTSALEKLAAGVPYEELSELEKTGFGVFGKLLGAVGRGVTRGGNVFKARAAAKGGKSRFGQLLGRAGARTQASGAKFLPKGTSPGAFDTATGVFKPGATPKIVPSASGRVAMPAASKAAPKARVPGDAKGVLKTRVDRAAPTNVHSGVQTRAAAPAKTVAQGPVRSSGTEVIPKQQGPKWDLPKPTPPPRATRALPSQTATTTAVKAAPKPASGAKTVSEVRPKAPSTPTRVERAVAAKAPVPAGKLAPATPTLQSAQAFPAPPARVPAPPPRPAMVTTPPRGAAPTPKTPPKAKAPKAPLPSKAALSPSDVVDRGSVVGRAAGGAKKRIGGAVADWGGASGGGRLRKNIGQLGANIERSGAKQLAGSQALAGRAQSAVQRAPKGGGVPRATPGPGSPKVVINPRVMPAPKAPPPTPVGSLPKAPAPVGASKVPKVTPAMQQAQIAAVPAPVQTAASAPTAVRAPVQKAPTKPAKQTAAKTTTPAEPPEPPGWLRKNWVPVAGMTGLGLGALGAGTALMGARDYMMTPTGGYGGRGTRPGLSHGVSQYGYVH